MAIVTDQIANRDKTAHDGFSSREVDSPMDWDYVNSNLSIADQNVHIGTREFTMLRFGRTIRWLAKYMGRAVKYVARVITTQQIEFNQSIVIVARSLANAIRQHSAQIADQTRQIEKYDGLVSRHRDEIEVLKKEVAHTTSALRIQEQLVCKLLDEMQLLSTNEYTDSNNSNFQRVLAESEHIWDALYVKFEEKFRGTREEIKSRLTIYLPKIIESGLGKETSPILDIACGRGEWLELLKENGFISKGVDLNLAAIEQCHKNNLEAIEDDAFAHMRRLPNATYGMVTAFHFVEHLSFHELIKFFDESIRVLIPGGMIIFETPNPENISVGSNTFYMDPTHRNPLPAPVLEFIAKERGFADIEVVKLNPYEDAKKIVENSKLDQLFNEYFYGPRDYALIGRKKI